MLARDEEVSHPKQAIGGMQVGDGLVYRSMEWRDHYKDSNEVKI